MSYILEALKKAELKQEQEEPSKVPTFLAGHVREPVSRSRWPYVLIIALLLNAALVTWLLIPGKSRSPAVVAPTVQQHTVATRPAKAINKENTAKAAVSDASREVLNVPVASGPAPLVIVEKPKSPSATPTPTRPIESPSTSSPERPRPTGKVLSLNEVPPTIRNSLPEFRISGHAYTPEPSTRVARINEKILQEGQDLSPGLRLEEIIRGGVIMTYEGYRFRINIKEN